MAGFTGGCLCERVRYECSAEPKMVVHCYCVDCRKSSGTGHGTHLMVPAEALQVRGEVSVYERDADSGNTIRRVFCPVCGSPLYSTNSSMPGMAFPRASNLDDPDVVTPQMAVFTSRAPRWDAVDPKLPAVPEMPDLPG